MSSDTFNLKEIRNYKFRIYPNKKQEQTLWRWIEMCRVLYNSCIVDRKNFYSRNVKGLTRQIQQTILTTDKKKLEFLRGVHSQALQEVLFRVDKAYRNFFRRIKKGEIPGYPRYKKFGQYRSITFTQFGDGLGASILNGKLRLSKVGLMKINLHREIPGTIKTVTIKKYPSGRWYAVMSVEEYPVLYSPNFQKVGVDVGVKVFAFLSNGKEIQNPKHHAKYEAKLKTMQRSLNRKKKGSKNREKARVKLARLHDKIRNCRHNFHHRVSSQLVWRYGRIAVEDLVISNMMKNHRLAKSIADVGWGGFISKLSYKAESAGREVIKVIPHGTTQECSRCGATVRKDLSVRVHNCPHCGLVMDRDQNAANNIDKRAS